MNDTHNLGLCPACHEALSWYFGTISCPRCRSVVFFQPFDGRALKAGNDGWRPLWSPIGIQPAAEVVGDERR